MNDWRYESLKGDMKRLRDDLNDVQRRTRKIESWQSRVPFRLWLIVCWLVMAGIWVVVIADAAGAL